MSNACSKVSPNAAQWPIPNFFLGPRGPLIVPLVPVQSRPVRKKNPDHLYSLINHRKITVNLSKEKKGKREKEKKRKREKEKREKEKREKGTKRQREKEKKGKGKKRKREKGRRRKR